VYVMELIKETPLRPEMKERDKFLRKQREWLLRTRDIARPYLSSRRLKQLCRTLTWNRIAGDYSDVVPAFSKYLQLYDTFTTLTADGWFDRFFEIGQVFKLLISSFCTNRRICRTINGHLGSLPRDVEAGDKICLFYGGRMAYVIRNRGNGKERFVGECYLDGCMYRAGMDETECKATVFSLI
jgi:hypothetical protein